MDNAGALKLQTPEGIAFSLQLASPVSRFLAWLIDWACIIGITGALSKLLSVVGALDRGFAEALIALTYFGVSIGYGIACEWYLRGQTPGKRLLRLRVMDAEALRLRFSQVVIRNLMRFVDALPGLYLVGGAVTLFTRNSQRLGDIAASTIVVRQPRVTQPDLAQLLGGKYNSLLEQRHLAGRLRQRVSPQAAAVALEALLRRDDLEPAARVDLFAGLASHFQGLVEFPPDTLEQLSDEQYVRNVVELLHGGINA